MLKRAGKATITLGRDCRLSSDRLFGLLSDGLLQSGINVVDIGVVPTPLLSFSVIHWRLEGGGRAAHSAPTAITPPSTTASSAASDPRPSTAKRSRKSGASSSARISPP